MPRKGSSGRPLRGQVGDALSRAKAIYKAALPRLSQARAGVEIASRLSVESAKAIPLIVPGNQGVVPIQPPLPTTPTHAQVSPASTEEAARYAGTRAHDEVPVAEYEKLWANHQKNRLAQGDLHTRVPPRGSTTPRVEQVGPEKNAAPAQHKPRRGKGRSRER